MNKKDKIIIKKNIYTEDSYLKERFKLTQTIRDSYDRLKRLDKNYISKLLEKTPKGSIVKCYRKMSFSDTEEFLGLGCLFDIRINKDTHAIEYVINKINKDGSMSKNSAKFVGVTRIELK